MPIHVIRYLRRGTPCFGVVTAGGVVPLDADADTTGGFLRDGLARARAAAGQAPEASLAAVEVLPPVTANQQVICQGLNYGAHRSEAGEDPAERSVNMIFRKASSALTAAHGDVRRPAHVRLLDHEIELGLVIGDAIDGPVDVTAENATRLIAGLVIVNDVSARDVQIPEQQFYKGKSYRTFAPVGPYLCLLEPGDERYLGALDLELRVNGEVRQRGSTGQMIHGPLETVAMLSRVQDLAPGDLISTGTPSGVALSLPGGLRQRLAGLLPERLRWRLFVRSQERSSRYLRDGDVIESRIRSADGRIDLGLQRNRVVPA